MRERIRMVIALFLYYSGVVLFAHWTAKHAEQRLIVLCYHRAEGNNLRKQIQYLRRYYRIMHLEDALKELYASDEKTSHRDRRTMLALTFDDGYLDNYTYGLQLARDLKAPITIFPVCSNVESGRSFAWMAGENLVKHTRLENVTVDGCTYNLTRQAGRDALAYTIFLRTRNTRSVAEREAFLANVQQSLQVELPTRPCGDFHDLSLPVTWHEVREMEATGWVSFGGHTINHPVLARLADVTELQDEIAGCHRVLEQQLGHDVPVFAYPVGKNRHIGTQAPVAVKAAGFQWALTTIPGINTRETDPFLLHRLPGDVNVHWIIMAVELVGLLGIVSRYRKKLHERFFSR